MKFRKKEKLKPENQSMVSTMKLPAIINLTGDKVLQ